MIGLKLVPFVFLAMLMAALGYALKRGQWAERAGVSTIVLGSVLSAIAAHSTAMWHSPETGIFVIDVFVLLTFVTIMARSDRFWPLWITALQIVAVATHIARIVEPQTIPLAYAVAEQLWAYPMLAIITVATIRNRRTT